MKLKVLEDTTFKLSTQQSSNLDETAKVLVQKGTEYIVHSHLPAEQNHVKVALADTVLGSAKRNTWFIYAPHIEIEGVEPGNKPQDKDNPPANSPTIQLPGFQSQFGLYQPIIKDGHFTWAEATKNGSRIPVSRDIVENMIRIAHTLEEVRARLDGKAMTITSWYRDPVTNRRIGGASQSRHLSGDAVDFWIDGVSPYTIFDQLEGWWGSKGGLASASGFTHIDGRGYKARWDYGY